MSAKSEKKVKSSGPSTIGKFYLLAYNGIQTLGWSYMLLQTLSHFLNRGSLDTFWPLIKTTVVIFQNAAVLEVVHSAIGLVPSGVAVVLPQVYSRVFLVCGCLLATEAAPVSPGLPLCILAWSITEIIRYAYYTLNLINCVPQPLLFLSRNWGDLGQSATVNDYVDNTIEMLVPFIQKHGLDPMDLPDVIEGFEVRPLLITYSAWLKIYDGHMTGLVNVSRSGNQDVHYFAKMLRVRVQLQFTDLRFVYKYLVQVMNLGPTGGIIATLSRFVVIVDLLLDFNNDEVQLQQFRLTDLGRLRVRFTGNILTDWLVNPVLNVFLRIFDTIIIKVVEINIRRAVQDEIDSINASVKDVIKAIEAHN